MRRGILRKGAAGGRSTGYLLAAMVFANDR
jgi:hypothetical protein